MSEDAKKIETEQQEQPGELTVKDLEQVAGGVVSKIDWSGPGDEGPVEYRKIG
jgi:hypothetical protein